MGSVSISPHSLHAGLGRSVEVSACTLAASGCVSQARAHSGPTKYVHRRVQVAIHAESANGTCMQRFPKSFRNGRAAAGTVLCCVIGIHLDQATTGACCLVAKHRDEFCPGSVIDRLRQSPPRQALYVEFLNRDHIVVANQTSARLMQMVGPSASCRCVATCDLKPCLPASLRASHLSCVRALNNPQPAFRPSSRPQTRDESSIGEHSEFRDSEIDSDNPIVGPGRTEGHVQSKSNGPTLDSAVEHAGSNGRVHRQRSVKVDTNAAWHALEPQAACFEANAGKLAKAERREASLAAKAWKPRWLAVPGPAEEGLVGRIQLLQGPALQTCGIRRRLGVASPPLGERPALVDVASRQPHFAVGVNPLLKSGVVKQTLAFENRGKCLMLPLRQDEPISIRKNHPRDRRQRWAHHVSHLGPR